MGMDEKMREVLGDCDFYFQEDKIRAWKLTGSSLDNAVTALKSCLGEQIKNMPRTPYMSKCCQKAREETIDDVLRMVGE